MQKFVPDVLGVFNLCDFNVLNGAVHIRACLELTDNFGLEWVISESRKRGVEFKGGSLDDGFGGFDGFGGSAKHLALVLLLLQKVLRGSRDGFDGFGGFGGYGGFGRNGYPP